MSPATSGGLWVLWVAAFIVLFTGFANIAALLLSRTAGRKREMAIRLSVGAAKWQIVQQLLVESVQLGVLGKPRGSSSQRTLSPSSLAWRFPVNRCWLWCRSIRDSCGTVSAYPVLIISTGLLCGVYGLSKRIRPGFDAEDVTTAYLIKPKNDPGFIERPDTNLRSTAGA